MHTYIQRGGINPSHKALNFDWRNIHEIARESERVKDGVQKCNSEPENKNKESN